MTDEPAKMDIGAVARAWWLDLNRPSDKGGRDRASLAELKRSDDPLDIAFVSAFGRLRHRLGAHSEQALQRAAMIAHVLAHVREDDRRSMARALGPQQGGEKSAMSEARFRRLLQARDHPDLKRRLVRAVKMLSGKANVADLAIAIWWWNDRTRQQWAFRYLNAEPPAAPPSAVEQSAA
jgi:CRISPR system Cascade subunit CasB